MSGGGVWIKVEDLVNGETGDVFTPWLHPRELSLERLGRSPGLHTVRSPAATEAD